MTLIVACEADGAPLLFGDILVSRNLKRSAVISTPLVSDINSLIADNQDRSIAGVTQKVVLLHRHLCVAWTGQLLQAHSLISALRTCCTQKTSLCAEEILNLSRSFNGSDFADLQYIGYVYDQNRSRMARFTNMLGYELDTFSNLRVGGSGTEAFFRKLNLEARFSSGETSNYQAVEMELMSIIGLLSGEQVFFSGGAKDGWGGGFEMVRFDGEQFKKPDSMLYLHWMLDDFGDGGTILALESPLIFQFYREAIAYFWVQDPGGNIGLHSVGPPLEKYEFAGNTLTEISSNIVVNSICRVAGEAISSGAFVEVTSAGTSPSMVLTRTNGQEHIRFADSFFEKLLKHLPSRVDGIAVWGSIRWLAEYPLTHG